MVANDWQWSVEFAKSGVRRGVAQLVDDATPGLVDRLASDPQAFKQVLAVTNLVVAEAEELLQETATSARHAGLGWEEIGDAIGLTRQEAQLRFAASPANAANSANATSGQALVAPGMASGTASGGYPPIGTLVRIETGDDSIINRAGPHGWHGVDFSSTDWTLQFDDQQWEHKKTMRKEPAGEGWQRIGRWGPAVFWKRPTGLPILPGNPRPESFTSKGRLERAVDSAAGTAAVIIASGAGY